MQARKVERVLRRARVDKSRAQLKLAQQLRALAEHEAELARLPALQEDYLAQLRGWSRGSVPALQRLYAMAARLVPLMVQMRQVQAHWHTQIERQRQQLLAASREEDGLRKLLDKTRVETALDAARRERRAGG